MTRLEMVEGLARCIAYAQDRPHSPGIPSKEMREASDVLRYLEQIEGIELVVFKDLERERDVAMERISLLESKMHPDDVPA